MPSWYFFPDMRPLEFLQSILAHYAKSTRQYASTFVPRTVQEHSEREAKSRVKEKKPPKAAINLGTDVDAPWGEKIETSRKENHQIA